MEETYNFKLIKVINSEKQLGSKIYIFEHQRTGLKVYYSFPTNYVLNMKVSFYTPQVNEKGTTHILEHLLCHTKSRYKDKWYLPSYSNEKTSFNAMTIDDYTSFDVESKSITAFRTVVKSMLTSVFRKEFDFTDEEIAYEAGYIKDFDSVDGVIYNEIKRVIEDPESMADEYSSMIAFSNTHYANAPGGSLKGIMQITREELEEYYFKYYQLSNCKIFTSGGFDIFKLFEYLDKNICETKEDGTGIEKKKVEKIPIEKSVILTGARVPFYAPNGYPKNQNIYVWGIKLPYLESLEERALYEVVIKTIFDGSDGPFETILKRNLAKFYKKTILIERVNAPYLRITFYNVPEGAEDEIDYILSSYLNEIGYLGLPEEKVHSAVENIIKSYNLQGSIFIDPDMYDMIYYILKDDVYENSNLLSVYNILRSIDIDALSQIAAALCVEDFRFKFVMYPSVNYVNDIEDDIIANYEDYKGYSPIFEELGGNLAKKFRLNGTKQEVTKKSADLRKALDVLSYELKSCDGVSIYKFKEDNVKFACFSFDLRGLTDTEMSFIPVLVSLINRRLPKDYDSKVFVDAEVLQMKVREEYFKLEVKCYFKNVISLSFWNEIYSIIDHTTPRDIVDMLLKSIPVQSGFSEGLTRDLALRMDSNDLPYRGTIHRKSYFKTLFAAASSENGKAMNVYCDFHDTCLKVLRRSNLKIVTTSGLYEYNTEDFLNEMLVDAIYDFEDVEQREVLFKDDKEVTFHFANARCSATGVIKLPEINSLPYGKKMVCDRALYNFMYMLFRQLGLSYYIEGTISGEYATVTSHSIRCCDDYRSAFAACGIFFENFEGNLNHYKVKALDEFLRLFRGSMVPKLNTFRYIEAGISFEDLQEIPEIIEEMTEEDLKRVGKMLIDACDEAKVYAVCGPGSHPILLDDCGFNRDYAFPDFIIWFKNIFDFCWKKENNNFAKDPNFGVFLHEMIHKECTILEVFIFKKDGKIRWKNLQNSLGVL